MSRSPDEIVIAGGGIGGLAAALTLARLGKACRVLERKSAFSEDGAGIQLGPNGTKILAALGVSDHLQPNAVAPAGLSIRDGKTGRVLSEMPLGDTISRRHRAPYWTAHRQDLHGALLQTARAQTLIAIESGVDVIDYELRDSAVEAFTMDGGSLHTPALIGADGLWSKLRRHVTGSITPIPTGKVAYRCVLPISALPAGLSKDHVHIWLSPGVHVVHYPVRAGRELAIVVAYDDEGDPKGWSTPVAPEKVAARTAHMASILRDLVAASPGWRMWSLSGVPTLNTWTDHRVALLGDAAHPILPFLAQGGVLALEDAFILGRKLGVSAPAAYHRALEQYQKARMPRAARVVNASRNNGRIYHLSGPAAFARNAALKLIPPQNLLARFDWLYGWSDINA